MLSQVFTCTNIQCRINSFMGSYMSGMNICPGCAGAISGGSMTSVGTIAFAGYMNVYYSSGTYSPTAAMPAPPAPPPKGLEEAVKEDVAQAVTEIIEAIRKVAKNRRDTLKDGLYEETAATYDEIAEWLEEVQLPSLMGEKK